MPCKTQTGEEYRHHLAVVLKATALAGFVLGAVWLVVFGLAGQWHLVFAETILAVAILPCFLIGKSSHFSTGLQLAQMVCIVFVVMFCLLFDVPNDAAPRSTQAFLLVIALAGYINNRRAPDRYQEIIIGMALLAFIALSSTNFALPNDHRMPDTMRVYSAWSNYLVSTGMLCVGLAVIQMEFSHHAKVGRELRLALLNNEFELFFQPQVDTNRHIVGAEALIRWNHPTRGLLSPAEFIPVAERTGLMPNLGGWVIKEACKVLEEWRSNQTTKEISLSVNISADQFLAPDFVQTLIANANVHGVDASRLKLELTESVFVANVESVISKMKALTNAGFEISLDDFGTGYSSLSYLRCLPLTQLKIDRSFVGGVLRDKKDAALARNIVQMGHDLQLQVLAEGIETHEQFEFMRTSGCQAFQGFLFGRPVNSTEFLATVLKENVPSLESATGDLR